MSNSSSEIAGGSAEAAFEFKSEVLGTFLWRYIEPRTRLHELYERAKEKTWNPTRDLGWDSQFRQNAALRPPLATSLDGFADYDNLDDSNKRIASSMFHALEISEVLHGEQAALTVSSQLVVCMPSMEAKLFASSQVADEAKHVEFFARYLREIVADAFPPSPELKSLVELIITDPRWDMKFLVCQILIETLAMSRFQELKENISIPILSHALDRISRDEARHVRFGIEVLEDRFKTLSMTERERLGNWVLDNMLRLANSQNVCSHLCREWGWDSASVRLHLRQHRLNNPQITRSRLRLLSRNLDAVGLLTEQLERRIETIA